MLKTTITVAELQQIKETLYRASKNLSSVSSYKLQYVSRLIEDSQRLLSIKLLECKNEIEISIEPMRLLMHQTWPMGSDDDIDRRIKEMFAKFNIIVNDKL